MSWRPIPHGCPTRRNDSKERGSMTSIIGGYDTGLLDSSLFQLNRDDRTREGTEGNSEDMYVNVANGNLILQHKDAYLPSQGEDFFLVRSYNSRGTWSGNAGEGWSNNTT